MSEYGSGLTVWRKDGAAIDDEQALGLVKQMDALAAEAERCGAFEEEPECGLGWEEDDGGYTLVVTSSAAYHASLPEDLAEESLAHDVAYAEWLAGALEKKHPGVYRYEAGEQEW